MQILASYRKLFGANTDIIMKEGAILVYNLDWLGIFTASQNQMMAFLCHLAAKACDNDGKFQCSQTTIMEKLRLGRSRQTKCLKSLQDMGVITIERFRSKRIFKVNCNKIASLLLSK